MICKSVTATKLTIGYTLRTPAAISKKGQREEVDKN